MKCWFLAAGALAALVVVWAQSPATLSDAAWRDEGVLYLDHSLNARLHTVPVQAVHIGDGFWSMRRRIATERSLPTLLEELEAHGVVDNFRRLEAHADIPGCRLGARLE